jgi:hypothetical protein
VAPRERDDDARCARAGTPTPACSRWSYTRAALRLDRDVAEEHDLVLELDAELLAGPTS